MSGEVVRLNVYSPNGQQNLAYHSGVEVHGTEYCFGGGNAGGSGVTMQRPRVPPPGGSWVFYQSVDIGPMQKSKDEVQRILSEIRQDFSAGSYNLVSRNCNHFSEAFCQRLCSQGIPSWVNATAGIANSLGIGDMISKAMGGAMGGGGGKADASAGGLASAGLMGGTVGADGDLSGEIDWTNAGILNCSKDDAADTLRTGGPILSEEDGSAEMLFLLPFKTQVKLQMLHLSSTNIESAPAHVRIFANQRDLDMNDAAGGVPPTADFAQIPWVTGGDGLVTASLEVNFLKFQNLGFLAVHLCREDEEGIPEEGGVPISVQGVRFTGKNN
eukprot:gnl/MRDRNA2_/MRDRNA2_117873_c0_seq1.p1 gnl/MRDRNA2_/MRDRNA2_117873_c0~~gnl/MRDRNA2_/MRDRNA2_117873_c0_seq1.p1  ORF type:complete len:328 (-),score=75.36 gnl/MRDRNA2_/MRDRNA2_117873_c0_seq1:124-1107(-)